MQKSRHPKSIEPSDISKEFACDDFHLDSLQPTVSQAIDKSLTLATNKDIILITGSFSVVGEALEKIEVKVPLVIRLAGTNVEEGNKILKESKIDYIQASTLEDAANKAVEALKQVEGK